MPRTAIKTPSRRTQLKYAGTGKCQQCGKRKPRTATLCVVCAEKHAASTSGLKLRLMSEGLCTQCGKNKLDTMRLCRPCQDKHNSRNARAKAAGKRS